MHWMNTTSTYGWFSIIFHWVCALLIIGLFASGFYMVTLTYYQPLYHTLPEWHKWFGIWLLAFMTARLTLSFIQGRPNPIVHYAWEKSVSKIAHSSLLIGTWIILISGLLIIGSDGRAFKWLGLHIPGLQISSEQSSVAGDIHKWVAYGLIGLTLLHAAAAFKHHWKDKLPTLKRMIGK
ncbi:MAG: cytochrome b [Pseudomonadota bacterium]